MGRARGHVVPGEVLVALAQFAGQTVAAAAITDTWESVRGRFARLLGRGDARKTEVAEGWLAQTREQLAAAGPGAVEHVRRAAAERWAARFADLLDEDPSAEGELRVLAEEVAALLPTGTVSASAHSVAAGRDVHVGAVDGSVAAGSILGDVNMGTTYHADQIVVGGVVPEESRHKYFVDFDQVSTLTEIAQLCQAHSATLLCTGAAEHGGGALRAVSRFRRDYYPELLDLVSGRDIAIAWTNIGAFYENFFTDGKESISTFLKSRRVRFVGCHLFVGDRLVESVRADDDSLHLHHAEPYVVVARALIERHLPPASTRG